MKRLVCKILLALLPLFLLYCSMLGILLFTDEASLKLDQYINDIVTNDDKHLVGFAFDETPYKYLKYRVLSGLTKRDVIVLGSSRVLQFRKEMFTSTFYNAGYTIEGIKDFNIFMRLLPSSKLPDTLIIGLDQWMFNRNYDRLLEHNDSSKYLELRPIGRLISLVKRSNEIFSNLLAKQIREKSPAGSGFGYKQIGLNAYVNNTGFRNDGSMLYGMQIDKLIKNDISAHDYKFNNTFSRIKNGNARFEYAQEVNTEAIKELNSFLSFCKSKKIHVIAFIAPFANAVYGKMLESGHYNYMTDTHSYLQPLFTRYDYEFYDFGSLGMCGSSDNEAIDGFHGSESVYHNMLIKMLEGGSKLNKHCDVDALRRASAKRINRYTVYDY